MRVRCPFGQKDFDSIRTGGGACLQERGLAGQAVARVGADHHRLEDPVAGGVALPPPNHPPATPGRTTPGALGAPAGTQGQQPTRWSLRPRHQGPGGRPSPGVRRRQQPRELPPTRRYHLPAAAAPTSPSTRTAVLGRHHVQQLEVALGVWAVQKARSAIRCGSARSEQSDGGSLAPRARKSPLAKPPSEPGKSSSA